MQARGLQAATPPHYQQCCFGCSACSRPFRAVLSFSEQLPGGTRSSGLSWGLSWPQPWNRPALLELGFYLTLMRPNSWFSGPLLPTRQHSCMSQPGCRLTALLMQGPSVYHAHARVHAAALLPTASATCPSRGAGEEELLSQLWPAHAHAGSTRPTSIPLWEFLCSQRLLCWRGSLTFGKRASGEKFREYLQPFATTSNTFLSSPRP